MRFFRFMTITVLLLACMVLGSACAGARGQRGTHGPKGDTGTDGVGVENIVNNGDGTFTVNLTSGESYTTDNLTGPQGIQGIQGEKGDAGLPGVGIVWQGEWSDSTLYGQDDAVGYQGLSYISKQDGSINHVPTDTAWWDPWGATGPQGPQGQKGDKGDTGDQGLQGVQGEPGPNMIVAMGNILANGTISQGYNVASVTWDTANLRYQITLAGITYSSSDYVTLVTSGGDFVGRYESLSGDLLVSIYGLSGQGQGPFSFMVLDATP